MTRERMIEIECSPSAELTPEEIADGYLCPDFDYGCINDQDCQNYDVWACPFCGYLVPA